MKVLLEIQNIPNKYIHYSDDDYIFIIDGFMI